MMSPQSTPTDLFVCHLLPALSSHNSARLRNHNNDNKNSHNSNKNSHNSTSEHSDSSQDGQLLTPTSCLGLSSDVVGLASISVETDDLEVRRQRKRLWATHREAAEVECSTTTTSVEEEQDMPSKRFCKNCPNSFVLAADFPSLSNYPIVVPMSSSISTLEEEDLFSVQLFVKGLGGKSLSVCATLEDDVRQLSHCLRSAGGFCDDRLRFVFGGKQLEVGRPLSSYGVRKGSNIHLTGWLKSCDRSEIERRAREDEAAYSTCGSSASSRSRQQIAEEEDDVDMEGISFPLPSEESVSCLNCLPYGFDAVPSGLPGSGRLARHLPKSPRSSRRDGARRSTIRHVIHESSQKSLRQATASSSWLKNRRRLQAVVGAWTRVDWFAMPSGPPCMLVL